MRSAKKNFLHNPPSLFILQDNFSLLLQPNRQRIPTHLTYGPITAESAQNKCDLLNSFLCVSAFSSPSSMFLQTTSLQNPTDLESINCSSEEVYQLLTSLPSKTAFGPDEISSQTLWISARSIVPHLSCLSQSSLFLAVFPALEIAQYHTSLQSFSLLLLSAI